MRKIILLAIVCCVGPRRRLPLGYDAYSPGTAEITLWKGFQRNHAAGLEFLQADARSTP